MFHFFNFVWKKLFAFSTRGDFYIIYLVGSWEKSNILFFNIDPLTVRGVGFSHGL
jgi:hypothetical protein